MSVAAWAFWLLVVYVVLVLGLRVVIALRTTGRTGVSRAATPVEMAGNLVLLVGVLLGGLNLLLATLGSLDAWSSLDRGWVQVLGFACCGVGILGVFASQLVMGSSWRIGIDPVNRADLVTDGIFRYARNPIYDFMVIAGIGFTLLVPTWIALAGLVLMVVGLQIQVRLIEEPFLVRTQGEAYVRYGQRVGRFVPGLGKFAPGGQM